MAGDPEDARLYVAACGGDDRATDELVRRHHSALRALAHRQTNQPELADDAVQYAWMQLLAHITDVREGRREPLARPASVRFWLMKTARRAVTDGYRRRERGRQLTHRYGGEVQALGGHTTSIDIEDELVAMERALQMRAALEGLSDKQRALVDLLLADPPLSYNEISERADIPIGSIGPTRQRCIDRLRREIAASN